MNVVFVCTGNTCRSPMAAALLNRHLQRRQPSSHKQSDWDTHASTRHALVEEWGSQLSTIAMNDCGTQVGYASKLALLARCWVSHLPSVS